MSEADDQIAKAEHMLREAIEGIADHPNAKKDDVQAMYDALNLLVELASTRYKAAAREWRQDSALASAAAAQAEREKVQCECGEVTGERCAWVGPLAETVTVTWMPEAHRGSHTAAGLRGVHGLGTAAGAVTLRMESGCAESLAKAEGEWMEVQP